MSGLASLYNVPSTDQERAQWAFAHAAHHRDIIRVIYKLIGVQLTEYTLDPIDIRDTGTWEYQHQQMHSDMDALLGIAGNDLTNIDWKDLNLLEGWIFLNRFEHYQASQILGIG